ncbi:hypothetical protein SAMN05216436_1402 [bacterium A37T11]|nr:hypothetical protein SAMN05216436_1402 [bacterium A37T11]
MLRALPCLNLASRKFPMVNGVRELIEDHNARTIILCSIAQEVVKAIELMHIFFRVCISEPLQIQYFPLNCWVFLVVI